MPTDSHSKAQELLTAAARHEIASGARGPWLIAFSGGPDSTALAIAVANARPALGVAVHLVHVDHALDPASAERADRAAGLAAQLILPFHLERRDVKAERRRGENLEAAARRVRYDALEGVRQRLGADRILTAHHQDDQVETVLLRIRSGSGIIGLTGIRERSGVLWRPALELKREELVAMVAASGLEPNLDPANADFSRDRNRLRHRILPHLRGTEGGIDDALAALAWRASGARERLTQRLASTYDLRKMNGFASLAISELDHHPPSLNLFALQLLEQFVGFAKPSSRRYRAELLRQLAHTSATELPGPGGWRFRRSGDDRLELRRAHARQAAIPPFSYTLSVPGEVAVPELGGALRLERRAFEPWMLRGEPERAALALPEPPVNVGEVRNRRPGDRLRPLGAPGMRALKALLIDRKVARAERDRIPLLILDGRIAWVPGVTIDEALRVRNEGPCWVAEWRTEPAPASSRSTNGPGDTPRREDEQS